MKTHFRTFIIVCLCFSFVACQEQHFISDAQYRAQVAADYQTKKQGVPNSELFAIFDSTLTTPEKEALMFLYAYMPIGDITDYTGKYYLQNIRSSFRAQQEMPWGKEIPENIFRHFVLPIRINNENLDESRMIFYEELKDRVKNLSLQDAILEVNHWCHEKVIYTPSDARTSSPLASVKTAYGRCGEESTFTVAALRSVGIPARQVYTPRWAHTDDNHAWVEAWADGKWYFFGASEPEPILNLGWFNAPAGRGMLMHTKVFGRYNGTEEVMHETPNYTEINIIENYAPVTKASIKVTDANGIPVPEAKVEFKVYNYAEFFSVATKYTGKEGEAILTAGKGDMLVWASKNGKFGYGKLSLDKANSLSIVLDKKEGENYFIPMDLVPPAESAAIPQVTPEQRVRNDKRMLQEDSIRNAYVATFPTREQARDFAQRNQLDSTRITPLLIASRGNHQTITDFLSAAVKDKKDSLAIDLLEVISAKDLRDISPEVLADHLNNSPESTAGQTYNNRYILNPRIANEMLTPYKAFFQKVIPTDDAAKFRSNPHLLVEWCRKEIKINNEWNSQSIPMSPAGVWKARVADENSRNIFFVSLARSLGIPAWIDAVTGKIRYLDLTGSKQENGKTLDVDFDVTEQTISPTGTLIAKYQPTPSLDNPKYYSHFTLSKFKNGTFQLLNYDEGNGQDGTSWANLLKNSTSLDTGYYMLVTGSRMASGAVLSNVTFFTIEPDKTTTVNLIMRESKDQVQVIGNLNSEATFRTTNDGQEKSILQTTGRGYFIVGILGVGQEPTNHALRDIAALKKDFDKWGRSLVLLFPDEAQAKRFRPEEFPDLPINITYGIDENGAIQKMIAENMKLKGGNNLPVFVIADTFNRVVFVSQGYTIGLGEQLMKVIHGL